MTGFTHVAAAPLRLRWVRILLVVVLAGVVVAGIPGIRGSILRGAGWALVVYDPVEPADVIVIPAASGDAGLIEAADLVHSGIASRVAVFVEPPDLADREFARRGIPYDAMVVGPVRQLRLLGVTAVEQIPIAFRGSEAEAEVLPAWCEARRFRAVVVVSTTDHSRRLRRLLHRATKHSQTRVMIRPARHSEFDPDRWWTTRSGVRTEFIELQKLVLDVLRHPIS